MIKWSTEEMEGLISIARLQEIDELEFVQSCSKWVLDGGAMPEELFIIESNLREKRLSMQKAEASKRYRERLKENPDVSD